MLVYHEPRFRFEAWKGAGGTCDVKIYKDTEHSSLEKPEVIIISELVKPNGAYANQGLSTTNGIEYIARRFRPDFPLAVYIEYLPARGPGLIKRQCTGQPATWLEEFSLVTFKDEERLIPEWCFLSREDVETMIHEPFVYEYVNEDLE